ncbi:hypothetical protein EGW08_020848 [Elysia chlorotica]|uniref:DDE Tnp4 domain-containing protein n=1 Tax=Elysia chlorotica TaxID=188477 RepID=A0A433SQ74_ELYCH|nr:hypothetical protein EGW08_020848 [Elysia chlorotica]
MVHDSIIYTSGRGCNLPSSFQVLIALRFYASGTFQDMIGEVIGVSQVTGFPGVFACIDGTHVRIQRPREDEADYVNRKNFHSLNVQIVCNSDLLIMDCVARHPGSAHDARILRESNLFAAMEGQPRQLQGLILGDSGYPVREWLMTPFLQPSNAQQEAFNLAHRQTRVTVERCIGVLKRRFHSLHTELRLEPAVASRVVYACCMLHNKATMLGLNDDEPIVEGPAPDNLPEPGVRDNDVNGGAPVQHPEDTRPHIYFGLLWTDEWWKRTIKNKCTAYMIVRQNAAQQDDASSEGSDIEGVDPISDSQDFLRDNEEPRHVDKILCIRVDLALQASQQDDAASEGSDIEGVDPISDSEDFLGDIEKPHHVDAIGRELLYQEAEEGHRRGTWGLSRQS